MSAIDYFTKRNDTRQKPSSSPAYLNIAIEQRPLGDGKESTYCWVYNRVIAHIHTESSRLGLLIAVVVAGLGVLDVRCVVVLGSVGDGQEGYSQEAQVTEHCCSGGRWWCLVE